MNTTDSQCLTQAIHRRPGAPRSTSRKCQLLAALLFSIGLANAGEERPTPRADLYGDPLPEGAVARMGSLRLRHGSLDDFLVLPDGKTILVTGKSPLVSFWDIPTGRQVRQIKLQGEVAPILGATPSLDGKTLATLHASQLALWEIASGKQIKTLPVPQDQWANFYISPDNQTVVLQTYKPQVIVWNWKKGTSHQIPLTRTIGFGSDFNSYVSPDGKILAVAGCGQGQLVCLYDLATGNHLRNLDCRATNLTFSPDGKRLAVSSSRMDKGAMETVIRVFDPASGKETAQYPLGHQHSYFSLNFAPDGKILACGFSDRSCLLDTTTGRVLHKLADRPIGTAFTPDGKTLIANMGQRFRVIDVASGKVREEHPGDFGWQPVAAISPNGQLLAAADWMDPSVSLWDMTTGRLLRTLPLQGEKRYVRNLAFSADGKTLFAGQYKGFLQFWDVASGKEQRTLQLHDPGRRNPDFAYFFQLHVAADAKHVSTLEQFFDRGRSTRLAYWDMETGKILKQHFLPPELRTCSWSSEGTWVALPLGDGLTQMNSESGVVRFRQSGTRQGGPLAASPDDRLLAAVRGAAGKDDTNVGIWEAATGKEIVRVAAGSVTHLALLPDDRHLLVADPSSLRVWDLATGKDRHRWPLPEANTHRGGDPAVRCLRLAPDGSRAFTALNDGAALVWDVQAALRRRTPLAGKAGAKELAAWWADLAGEDPVLAYAAFWRLTDVPETAIPFLRQRLPPAAASDIKAIRLLLADLDNDAFATREKAFQQLAKLGPAAEPALRHALGQSPAPEARRRMQELVEKIDRQSPSGEVLRQLRAVHVLENAGAEGRRLLRELAKGAEGAWLTRAAQTALTRMDRPR